MSYDLAVWEGKRPSTNAEAARVFRRLYDENIGGKEDNGPTPVIHRTAFALVVSDVRPALQQCLDVGWPLNNARGPIF